MLVGRHNVTFTVTFRRFAKWTEIRRSVYSSIYKQNDAVPEQDSLPASRISEFWILPARLQYISAETRNSKWLLVTVEYAQTLRIIRTRMHLPTCVSTMAHTVCVCVSCRHLWLLGCGKLNVMNFRWLLWLIGFKIRNKILRNITSKLASNIRLLLLTNYDLNPLNTKRRPLYLKTQFVPRSKHFSSRL